MIHTEIPQNRDRVFMAAFSRDHFSSNTFRWPIPLPKGSCRPVREFFILDKQATESLYFRPGHRY